MAPPIQLGPRARTALRVAGFVALGLVTFVFALQYTFPLNRVKDKVTEALSEKYDVQIGSIKRGTWPGTFYLENVSLRTHVTKADDVPTTFYSPEIKIHANLLPLLRMHRSIDFDAQIGAGQLSGNVTMKASGTSVSIAGDGIPSASLPMREALGLPMSGTISLDAALDLPVEELKNGRKGPNWESAEGHLAFACPSGCTVGDGKTKLKPKLKNARSAAFAEGGIEFGTIKVDSLALRLEIKDSKMEITKFEAKSADGELHIDFMATLTQNLDESPVAGCLRFTGSEALNKREPRTYAAISTTGAPRGPDGLFNIKLDGKMKDIKRLALPCGPMTNTNMDNPGAKAEKPTLTVQPESQVRPPAAPPPSANPGPPPIAPPTTAQPGAFTAPSPNGGSGSAGSGSDHAGSGSDHAEHGEHPPEGEAGSAMGGAGAQPPPAEPQIAPQ